jgi:hypothetical protein
MLLVRYTFPLPAPFVTDSVQMIPQLSNKGLTPCCLRAGPSRLSVWNEQQGKPTFNDQKIKTRFGIALLNIRFLQ